MYHITGAILILAGTIALGVAHLYRPSPIGILFILWTLLGGIYLVIGIKKDYRKSQMQDDTERKS